jgi:hypothetical protein
MPAKGVKSTAYAARIAKYGRERIAEQKHRYYVKHRETHKAKVYAYRAADKERWLKASREYQRKRVAADPHYWRKNSIKKEYGITFEQYEAMVVAQGGTCLVCCEPFPEDKNGKRQTHIDHCHETNDVRGVLCYLCNVMLGSGRDNPTILENAARYVRKHQQSRCVHGRAG